LLANDTARADLAARGRQRAEQHLTWEAVAHKTLASYRAALESRRGNPRSDKRRLG
jgi:glycosyltransferase involved in cell wall biosynthesis